MVTIHLDDSVAAALALQAQERGLSLQEYLGALATTANPERVRASAEEIIDRIRSVSVPAEATYRGSFSRHDIYSDHD